MGNLIFVLVLLASINCKAEQVNLMPLLRAAAIQTGLEKDLSQIGTSVYNLLIPVTYQPYLNVTVQIVDAINKKEIYVSQKWEFQ